MAEERTTLDGNIFLDHLTREDLARIAPTTTVILPTGSTEQHSTHLPLCVDTVMASELAQRVARVLVDEGRQVSVAPAMAYGFSHHHLKVGGALSIRIDVYIDLMTDLARSLAEMGFPRLVFLNGHGGNDEALRVVANRVVHQERLPLVVAVATYWDIGRDVVLQTDVQQVGPTPGHAGGFETSCMLAVRPELVRLERRPAHLAGPQPLVTRDGRWGGAIRRPGLWELSHGCSDDASRADAAIGARVVEGLTGALTEFVRRLEQTGAS